MTKLFLQLGIATVGIATALEASVHVGTCEKCTHTTLEAARDSIRDERRNVLRQGLKVQHIDVIIHEGRYGPLVLDEPHLDSDIHFAGFNHGGEQTPIISAGQEILKTAWTAAGGSLPEGTLVANLSALGLSPGGTLPSQGSTCCDECDQETQLTAQLFHELPGVVFQPNIARYPNAGKMSNFVA